MTPWEWLAVLFGACVVAAAILDTVRRDRRSWRSHVAMVAKYDRARANGESHGWPMIKAPPPPTPEPRS